jgi:hypothetical protein
MFERCHRKDVPIVHRSGRSIATLMFSAAGIVLVGVAWSMSGPLRGATAGPGAQVKAPPKAAPEGLTAPPPAPGPSIARARNPAKQGLLDLEDAIARAELVIAVRLVDVSESKVVHGGKQVEVTAQYRFEPVRTLKGIYARDALLLTDRDLGIYRYGAGPDKVERGQVFLLLLGRNGPGYFNCNQAGSLDLSIPRLSGQDDPLLPAVDTLIAVTQQRDRSRKVSLLIDGLRVARGHDAVPLLVSLRRRALLAAQSPGALEALARPLRHPSTAVKEAAALALTAVLEADYLGRRALRDGAAEALIAALQGVGTDVATRVALLDALGATGKDDRRWARARPWLAPDLAAPTFAEGAARFRALGKLAPADQRPLVSAALGALPFDAPGPAQEAAGRALGALDPAEAARQLIARLAAKYDAGLDAASEIGLLGELPGSVAAPALLDVARRELDAQERFALAVACARVKDPRLVPVLARLIDPTNLQVRWTALDALMTIDTPEAARAAWPHLAEESDLTRKLRLAGFVGRHGYRGGYPYAIEHLADPNLLDVAVEALAAIREPRAIPELRAIWQKSNDLGWNAAAVRALGRLGESDIASRLLALAQDLKDPLTAPALIALGDLNETRALPLVRAGLASRSDEVVIGATRASRRLLARPGVQADDIRDALAAILADAHAAVRVRDAALQALVALDDPRLHAALGAAVRDAALEGTDLLRAVEERLAARKEAIKQ